MAGLLDELDQLCADVPYDQLPVSFKELYGRFPQLAPTLKEAQKIGALSKDELVERGILRLSKKATVEHHLRKTDVATLTRLYCAVGGPEFVMPNDGQSLLPAGAVGIDVVAGVELREAFTMRSATEGLAAGDTYNLAENPPNLGEDVVPVSEASRSRLAGYLDPAGLVLSVEDVLGQRMARVRCRMLGKLSADTLLCALWGLGAVTVEDLCGGQRWRRRLGDAHNVDTFASGTNGVVAGTSGRGDSPTSAGSTALADVAVIDAPDSEPPIVLGFATKQPPSGLASAEIAGRL